MSSKLKLLNTAIEKLIISDKSIRYKHLKNSFLTNLTFKKKNILGLYYTHLNFNIHYGLSEIPTISNACRIIN